MIVIPVKTTLASVLAPNMNPSMILSSLVAASLADADTDPERYFASIDEAGLPEVQLLQRQLGVHPVHKDDGSPDSDDATLFQSKAGVKVKNMLPELTDADKKDAIKVEALVEQLAAEVVTGETTIDDTTKEALKDMKKTFDDTSKTTILATHSEDQSLLRTHADSVARCGTQFRADGEEDAALGAGVDSKEETHSSCRDQLRTKLEMKTIHCNNLDDFHKSLIAPTCAVPASVTELRHYLNDLETWSGTNLRQFDELDQLCTDATKAYEIQLDSCNDEQVQFETGFCQYVLAKHETCYTNSQCYDAAKSEFKQTKESALSNAESRKLEWTAIEKIQCYIDVLLDDGAGQSNRQQAMDACQGLKPDTAHLDIDVPDLAEQVPCDLSDVALYPGAAGFEARYGDMANLRDVVPCPDLEPHLLTADETDAKEIFYYVGCFTDDWDRDMEQGPQEYGHTLASCRKACADFKFMALQNSGWCVCGNAYATQSQYHAVDDGECGGPCTDETAEVTPLHCGGAFRSAIYGMTPPETAEATSGAAAPTTVGGATAQAREGGCSLGADERCYLKENNMWEPDDIPPYIACLTDCCQDYDESRIFDGITCSDILASLTCDSELEGMHHIPAGTKVRDMCCSTCSQAPPPSAVSSSGSTWPSTGGSTWPSTGGSTWPSTGGSTWPSSGDW